MTRVPILTGNGKILSPDHTLGSALRVRIENCKLCGVQIGTGSTKGKNASGLRPIPPDQIRHVFDYFQLSQQKITGIGILRTVWVEKFRNAGDGCTQNIDRRNHIDHGSRIGPVGKIVEIKGHVVYDVLGFHGFRI